MTAGSCMTRRVLIRRLLMVVPQIVGGIRMTTTMLVTGSRHSCTLCRHTAIHAESGEWLTQQQYEQNECAKAHGLTLASDRRTYK
jgi:hypothetical protein